MIHRYHVQGFQDGEAQVVSWGTYIQAGNACEAVVKALALHPWVAEGTHSVKATQLP